MRLRDLAAGLAYVLLLAMSPTAQGAVVLDEDFSDVGDWDDLSIAVTWDGHVNPTSAFEVVSGAAQLKRSGPETTVGYTEYSASDQLKTFTVLDRRFALPIQHLTSTVTVQVRARWDKLDASGEKGRLVLTLTHDYPAGGLDLDLDDRYDDFDQDWWARPAYQLRLRSAGTGTSQGTTLLMYGGGLTDLGEFESNESWWLPGFNAAAGGGNPGIGPDFPENAWVRTATGLATTEFRSYRWVVRPSQQEIWFDEDDDGFDPADLKAVMPLPAASTAPLYRYFDTFEGIRMFWRGAGVPDVSGDTGQVYVDHLEVTVESHADPIDDLPVWALIGLVGLLLAAPALVWRRQRAPLRR